MGKGDKDDEVIPDNLDVMRDIIMQLREDEEFAKSIYTDCPRLQHLLDRRPDLRPIFEDPKLVRINFEEVYRKEGGVLPEDEAKKKSLLSIIVNSPCFKVLRVFLFIKKLFTCIFGGGFNLLKNCFTSLFCCDGSEAADAADLADAADAPPDPNKEQLYSAADHMEDPEVQEQMNELLENDPEGLQEAIDNDKELSALRDSSPLCAELMQDPETMKILTDPENLRALGDAPSLIEADFADPDWEPPVDDIESGHGGGDEAFFSGGGAVAGSEGVFLDAMEMEGGGADGADCDANADADADGEGEEGEDGEEEEEDEHMLEEYELGENDGDNRQASAGNKKSQQKKSGQKGQQGGGFMSQVGAGITDMIAGELVGVGVSEITGGGDDPLAGLDDADAVEDAADEADGFESAAQQAAAAAETSEMILNEDVAGGLEEGLDEIEDNHDDKNGDKGSDAKGNKAAAVGTGAAAGAVGAGALAAGTMRGKRGGAIKSLGDDDGEDAVGIELDGEEGEDGEEKKKGRFGVIGNWASAVKTAGKEYIAQAILGDDLGEMLVERIEDDDESSKKSGEGEDDDASQKSSASGEKGDKKDTTDSKAEPVKGEGDAEEEDDDKKKKKNGLFRRKNR